jgi:hypothetical protein
MPPRRRILPDPPPVFAPVPDWGRNVAFAETIEDATFLAGGAFAALHPIATSDHPLTKLWRQRLALACAEAVVVQIGRSEDKAALRDHLYLTRPGDDPGPAGNVLAAWRMLASSLPRKLVAMKQGPLFVLGSLLSIKIDEEVEEVVQTAIERRKRAENPIDLAAETASLVMAVGPALRPLGLWWADMMLAHHLEWPHPLPLLAAHIKRSDLRFAAGSQGDREQWRMACARTYRQAAMTAFDLYADLVRRGDKLIEVAPKLRGRDADETVRRILEEDAVTAEAGATTTDRSMRRLFDRLVELGAVRELTGRSTSRLYGL